MLSQEDSVWIPETWGMECFGIMSAISQRSKCRSIGSSIINVYSRSPALLAMGAITLDTLSGGRFILGLGSSSPTIVTNLHGNDFNRPLLHVRECIQIIRKATSGSINYTGDLYQLQGFSLLIKPVQPKIPIYLAAINHKMVNLAWEMADGVMFFLRPMDEMRETIREMQQNRRIRVTYQIITSVSDNSLIAYERARRTLAFYISVGHTYRMFLARNGYQTHTDRIYHEYKTYGLKNTSKLVPDDMLHALTACGTPSECRSTLSSFKKAGVDETIMQFNPVGNTRDSFKLLMEMSR